MPTGSELIHAERRRQVVVEGWDPDHDDQHGPGVLLQAAHAYVQAFTFGPGQPSSWPWDTRWWKPSPDPVRNLVKAGALQIAAAETARRSHDEQRAVLIDALVAGTAACIDAYTMSQVTRPRPT